MIGMSDVNAPVLQEPQAPLTQRHRRNARSAERARFVVLPAATAIGGLALWELLVRLLHVQQIILPAPSAIAVAIVSTFPLLMQNAVQTAWETAAALILASILGISIGIGMTYSKTFRAAIYPNMIFFQLIPKVALGPLFIMWLGIGSPSRLTFALFVAFFPIALSTATGLAAVDASYIRFCKSLTATDWQIFTNVRFPFALPNIFAGIKIGVTMAFIGIIVGEFITSQSGLGYLIMFASARGETAVVFAAIFILCMIGLAYYGAVALLEIVLRRFWGPVYS
jgi:NitT/TauT family transport system permease protein